MGGAGDASDPCHPQPDRHPVGAGRFVSPPVRRHSGPWTALFLITTVLTSLSGFPLPPFGFDPPRAVGVLSLVLLLAAVAAYYAYHLAGIWRLIYVACAVAALYLNVFVLVAQGFLKVPFLHDLAPTGSEPPFAVVQGIVLVIFVALGFLAARRFHPGTTAGA
jgi:hypothetical protein